jgi:hypothetical protein
MRRDLRAERAFRRGAKVVREVIDELVAELHGHVEGAPVIALLLEAAALHTS